MDIPELQKDTQRQGGLPPGAEDFLAYQAERLTEVERDPTILDEVDPSVQKAAADVESQPVEPIRNPGGDTPAESPPGSLNKGGTKTQADEGNELSGSADKAEGDKPRKEEERDTPAWFKARLGREKKEQRNAQRRIKELEAKLAEKEAGVESNADITRMAAPDRDDYEDISQYIEDSDAWADGVLPPHDPTGKYAKAATPKTEQEAPNKEPEQSREDRLMDIVQETVDMDKSVEDENLFDNFRDLLDQKKIVLTDGMLEFLAHDNEASLIIGEFVKRPVASRRIALLPDFESQIAEMDSLQKALKNPQPEEQAPANQRVKGQTFDSRPPQGQNPQYVDYDNMDQREYERIRNQELKEYDAFAFH